MAALLALLSATTYGIGDFFGGMASRRAPAAAVLLWSHVVGVVLVLVSAIAVGGELTARDMLIGALGGLAGAAAVGMLYQALSIGPMSVVAPVTALLAAAVPFAGGVVQGERPSATALVGVAAALGAMVLVSADGGGSLRPSDPRGLVLALGAGFGFGLFFLALSYTDEAAGVWPIVGARLASVTVMGTLALTRRIDSRIPAGPGRRLTAGAGALDVGANVLFLLAIRAGLLSIVSVLASLYPVSTVVLAHLVLRERYARIQLLGIAIAVPATVLMAL